MKVLISERLSAHKYKTPEGYLICTDAILARTGKQTYTKDELFNDNDASEVEVDRPYNEVMSKATIASFENKPVTFDHPEENVNVGNYKSYAVGYVRDVKQGKTNEGEDVIMGNLVITDQEAINAIEEGNHNELSCGYDCDIVDTDNGYEQHNIRGNHVALCECGRAGNARIIDSIKESINDGGWYSTEYISIKSSNDITLSNIVKAVKNVVRNAVKTITNGTLEDTTLNLQVYSKDDMSKKFNWITVPLSFTLDVDRRYYKCNEFDDIAYYKEISAIKSKLKTFVNRTIYEDRSLTTDSTNVDDMFEHTMKIKKSDVDVNYLKKALKEYKDITFVKEDSQYIYLYGDPNDVNYLEFESSIGDSKVKDSSTLTIDKAISLVELIQQCRDNINDANTKTIEGRKRAKDIEDELKFYGVKCEVSYMSSDTFRIMCATKKDADLAEKCIKRDDGKCERTNETMLRMMNDSVNDVPIRFVANVSESALALNVEKLLKNPNDYHSLKSNLNSIMSDIKEWRQYSTQGLFKTNKDLLKTCKNKAQTYIRLLNKVSNIKSSIQKDINRTILNIDAALTNTLH